MQLLSEGAQFYEQRRLEMQGNQVLEQAWLLFQEMTIKQESVDPITLKKLKNLYAKNRYDEVQMKMRVVRSKWLPHDNDASLSLKAMELYAEVIKTGIKTPEQNLITRHVN